MFSVSVTGTNSSLTAAAVVVTGLVGANFVQATLDKLRFRDPIARGIATASRYVHLLLINQSVLSLINLYGQVGISHASVLCLGCNHIINHTIYRCFRMLRR